VSFHPGRHYHRLRRLDIEAISRRIIERIKGGTYIIDSTPIKEEGF